MWAEFRMFPIGLVLGILLSCVSLLFSAPGAVYIYGSNLIKEVYGKISTVGPVINIVIGRMSTILYMVSFTSHSQLYFIL